jgi:hypothetical protein
VVAFPFLGFLPAVFADGFNFGRHGHSPFSLAGLRAENFFVKVIRNRFLSLFR